MAFFYRFIGLFLFLFASSVFAVVPLQDTWTAIYGGSRFTASSAIGACELLRDYFDGGDSRSSVVVQNGSCKLTDDRGIVFTFTLTKDASSCPANSTPAQIGSGCTCNSGYIEEGGQCVAELSNEAACGAAFYNNGNFKTETVRLEGNISDGAYCQEMGDSIKPGLACTMRFDKGMAWKTDDGKWHSEGTLQPQIIGGKFQPCVPGIDGSGDPPDPKKPPDLPKKQDPTCPNGYKGDVGGVERCIPSYGYNGVDFAPKTKYTENDKTRTETTTKTECADGKCTTTVTEKVTDKATGQTTTTSNSTTEQDREWCAKPKNKDQCAANGKPAYSGQGTGASGGGSGSGNGNGNGDGDDKGGKCGAKNQPPCKIDEQGTPDGKNVFDDVKGQLDRDHQSKLDTLGKIQSAGDKDTSLGFSGGFGWLTHRTCMPWNFGNLEINGSSFTIEVNVCPIEPIISSVMNFLWILGTLFATIYRVSAVMGARVE